LAIGWLRSWGGLTVSGLGLRLRGVTWLIIYVTGIITGWAVGGVEIVTDRVSFWVVTLSVHDGVVRSTLLQFLVQIVVNKVVFFRLSADVLASRNAVKMYLMEDGVFGTHPRVASSSNAVVESLASDGAIGVVSVFSIIASEFGSLQKKS
jgi:hypothetical protein